MPTGVQLKTQTEGDSRQSQDRRLTNQRAGTGHARNRQRRRMPASSDAVHMRR